MPNAMAAGMIVNATWRTTVRPMLRVVTRLIRESVAPGRHSAELAGPPEA